MDLAGNVGLSVHKVVAAPIVLQQPQNGHLVITPSGTPAGGGWFGGNVSVTITPDPGFTASYSLDGGAITKYTAPFLVKGDGIHLVDAVAENPAGDEVQASAAIGIDRRRRNLDPLAGRRTVRAGRAIAEGPLQLPRLRDRSRRHERVRRHSAGRGQRRHDGRREDVHGDREDALGRVRTMSVSYRVWRTPGEAFTALIDKTLLYLKQAPLGATLKAALTQAANQVAANNKPAACVTLNVYIAAVKAASSSALTAVQKADLVADATRIKTLIGCTT